MQQFYCSSFYIYHFLHISAYYKAIFRWALYDLLAVPLLHAEPHISCFVIPNKICLEVHKIH
jgi:hypothetical protein